MYLGDSYVQSMVELAVSTRPTIGRRALRLFAATQNDDGQFPNVAPSWYTAPIYDFSLIYAIWLDDYWQQTEDLSVVTECFPAVERMLASLGWVTSSHSVLWDVPDAARLLVDWTVHQPARKFQENAWLNAFRYRALQGAAALAGTIDQPQLAQQYAAEAEAVRAAFRERLWLSSHGRFAGGTEAGQPIDAEVLHANVLALAYGLADEQQEAQVIPYVLKRLAGNVERARIQPRADDYIELYFLKFTLDALARIGRHDAARQLIIDHMTPMRDAGAPTLWECLGWGLIGRGSRCHAWSAGPAVYLAKFANRRSAAAVEEVKK
jgi:glycogen debranching enzyme